jgi:hypothetical protein
VVIVGVKYNDAGPFKPRSVDNIDCLVAGTWPGCVNAIRDAATESGAIMAKRKKGSKVKSGAKLRRASSAKRGKAHKAKATKRTVAKAKPKPAPAKKAAPKAPVVAAVETVAVEVVEQPVAVVEEIRKAS